jgi:hypothetical protein
VEKKPFVVPTLKEEASLAAVTLLSCPPGSTDPLCQGS